MHGQPDPAGTDADDRHAAAKHAYAVRLARKYFQEFPCFQLASPVWYAISATTRRAERASSWAAGGAIAAVIMQ
jgi:hypothetical protein